MTRPSNDEYYLRMLELVASRSTCGRRHVAAIIVDEDKHVLSTGYNGVPRDFPHCRDTGGEHDRACEGRLDKSGDSSRCLAVHAEQNALLQCHDIMRAHTLYVSCSPCFTCAKMIANTRIKRVVCMEAYADDASQILKSAGIELDILG